MKALQILLVLVLACTMPCCSKKMEQLLQMYRKLPIDDAHKNSELLHLAADSLTEKNVETGVATIKHFWSVEVPHRLQQLSRGGEERGALE